MKSLAGSILVQRFRLDALENRTDGGDVYRGQDLQRGLPVAVTVLPTILPTDPGLTAFSHDNLTLQTLTHKNIIPFYGLYQDQSIAFLVERYIEGSNLKDRLEASRWQPVSVLDSMIYLKGLCGGLGYVHNFGLVHCSVQPAQVRVDTSGNILLGGFGFARSSDSRMGAVSGPPAYLAPESLRRENVTPATDAYGLGMILYELLTGHHPFQDAGSDEAMIRAILLDPPPDPRGFNPAISGGCAKAILTALAKEPRERFQNTQEMLEVACAVNDYVPEQIPDRLGAEGSAGWTGAASTEIAPPYGYSSPSSEPSPYPGTPPTDFAGTQPGGGEYFYPANPAQVQPGGYPPMDEIARAGGPPLAPPVEHWGFAPGYAGEPMSGTARPTRKLLPAAALGAAGLGVLLCAFLVGIIALPAIRGLIAVDEASPTPTLLAESTATPLPSATLPVVLPTTPPTFTAFPTQPPTQPPTLAPTATMPPSATFTEVPPPVVRTAFTVTIRNNLSYPIYAFRNNVLMGTDPIPPARYIFYRNIPAGNHTFKFCEDIEGFICGHTRRVDIDRDLTIALP